MTGTTEQQLKARASIDTTDPERQDESAQIMLVNAQDSQIRRARVSPNS
jgi:hypothetical protein